MTYTVTLADEQWSAIQQLIIANADRNKPITGHDQITVLHEAWSLIHKAGMEDYNNRFAKEQQQ